MSGGLLEAWKLYLTDLEYYYSGQQGWSSAKGKYSLRSMEMANKMEHP